MKHKIYVAERNIAQFRKKAKKMTGVKILSEKKAGKTLAKSGSAYVEADAIVVELKIRGDFQDAMDVLGQV